MRSIPGRLFLSAAVVVVFAVVPLAATASTSSVAAVGRLKLCTYSAGNLSQDSETFVVKLVAAGGAGKKGSLRFAGAGLNKTVPFTLKKGGIALVSFQLTQSATVTLTTKLATVPVRTRVDHVTFTSGDVNAAAPRGCVAR